MPCGYMWTHRPQRKPVYNLAHTTAHQTWCTQYSLSTHTQVWVAAIRWTKLPARRGRVWVGDFAVEKFHATVTMVTVSFALPGDRLILKRLRSHMTSRFCWTHNAVVAAVDDQQKTTVRCIAYCKTGNFRWCNIFVISQDQRFGRAKIFVNQFSVM